MTKFLTIFRLTSVSWPSRPSPPTPRQTRGWARLAVRRDRLQAQEERKIFEEKEKNIWTLLWSLVNVCCEPTLLIFIFICCRPKEDRISATFSCNQKQIGYKIRAVMASLKPKELVTLLNIIEEDLVEKNSLEKWVKASEWTVNEDLWFSTLDVSVCAADSTKTSAGPTTSRCEVFKNIWMSTKNIWRCCAGGHGAGDPAAAAWPPHGAQPETGRSHLPVRSH